MLRHLMQAFTKVAAIPLKRQPLDALAPDDVALAEDDPIITPSEIDAALQGIQAHSEARRLRHTPDPSLFFLALQQAEKFVFECLEFGPAREYHIKASRLDRAFTIWARGQRFSAVPESDFAKAMQHILTCYGGHRANQSGSPTYMGCRLRAEVVLSISRTTKESARINAARGKVIDSSSTA